MRIHRHTNQITSQRNVPKRSQSSSWKLAKSKCIKYWVMRWTGKFFYNDVILYSILDSIRQTTNLSHELSCIALKVVLSELETIYSTPVLQFIEPIAKHFTAEQLSAPDEFIEHTHDSHRLKLIFGQLAECKNDSEQRTWMLHEDEDYIVQFLTELIEILVSGCGFNLTVMVRWVYNNFRNFELFFFFKEKCRQKSLSIWAVLWPVPKYLQFNSILSDGNQMADQNPHSPSIQGVMLLG